MVAMDELWLATNTTTHQDHVIAHVVGTTVLGYVVLADAVHLLLDIGFIWKVYVDGEMGLLLHPVALMELDVPDHERKQIAADVELLLRDGAGAQPLVCLNALRAACLIKEVEIFVKPGETRLVILGEESNLELEMSVAGDSIQVAES